MLELLRRGVKSWVAKALLTLLVASFAAWGIGDIFSFRAGSAVATVADEDVTIEEYADSLARQQSRLSQQAGRAVTYSDMRGMGFDRQILAGLVRDAALRAELKALGIAAPDKAVADAVRENPAFLGPAGNFSDQAYRLLLAQQRMTPAEFERLTRALIGQELVTGAVAGTDATAPGLGTRIAAWRGEMRKLRLLTLTPDMAAEPGEPDQGALRAFYEANGRLFREPERRYGRYLHVDAAALAEAERARLDEAAVRAVYEDEKAAYVTEPTRTVEQITFPSLAEAEAAAARLAAGEVEFDALAAEVGQEGAIDIGEVRPGDLPEGPDAAIFAMAEPGVTGAVKTPLGGAILRVTEMTTGGAAPFDEVRDEIAGRLAAEAAAMRAPEIANEIEEQRAAGKTFAEIAAEIGEGVVAGQIAGLGNNGTLASGEVATGVLADADAASEIRAAIDAEERDFVELSDGSYFLAYVERIEPARVPELESIRDQVVAAWREDAKLVSLEERAATIAAGIARGTGATLETTAAGMGRVASETEFFTRDRVPDGVPQEMAEAVFGAKEGEVVTGRLADGSGVVLAEVATVQPIPAEALAVSSERIESALAESIRRDRQEYFVRAVESHHGARINPQAIEEVFALLTGSRN